MSKLAAARRIGSDCGPSMLSILMIGALVYACGASEPVEVIRELHAEARFADSLEPLRELLEAQPDDPEVLFLYGVALRRTGQPSLALWTLRKASREPGWEVPAGIELAASAYQGRNFPVAIEEAGRVLEIEPTSLQALRLRAEARLADRGNVEAALVDLDRMLELDPGNLEIHVSRATAFLMLRRIGEAEQALGELESLAEDAHVGEDVRARYCVALATFAKERGESAAAERRYEDCLIQFPEDATVLEEAMVFFDAQGRPERAMELLRAAIERTPEAVGLREVLSGRLRAAGEIAEAEAVLRPGTEVESPTSAAFAWRSLADHYVALGKNAQAVESLERALELEEQPSQQLLLAYADLLVAAGLHERALEVAAGLEHDFFQDLIQARILLDERQPREAMKHFEAAFVFWPDNAAARYYAARAAEAMGDFDRAIEEYRQSIRAGAEYTDAGLRLAQLREAEGAYRLALAAAAHHVKAHGSSPEALLLELRLRLRTGEAGRVRAILAKLRRPETWAGAVSSLADSAATRKGPEAGVEVVRNDPWLELTNPRDAAALRTLVSHLLAAGEVDEALARADAGVARHPNADVFHEIRGFVLERRESPRGEVRAAYRRATELDPESARALAGLARLAAEAGDLESAIAYYDRAAAADPSDASAAREAAELLTRAGRVEEAERRLDDVIWEHPFDAAAAIRLSELRFARGAPPPRTLELARRANRFGGGPEARRLLERIQHAPEAGG